jgi:hypothetical protein
MAGAAMLKRFAFSARKMLPGRVRHVLRLGRCISFRGQKSAQLPASLIDGCQLCASRYDLIEHLPSGGVIAEVGTDSGRFARKILDICNPERLHLIDLDFSRLDPTVAQDSRVSLHRGASHEALKTFPDGILDWIYIDADHSFSAVARDAAVAASKVKPGGYLVFNDFAHADPFLGAYCVHRAVVDFAINRNWRFVWWAYHPAALYDVALQRPMVPNG